ncbi:DUF3995 domain-containing protein [Ekhidna sp.]|jgi:hypothetical protein|uniref:DUF3995 domain-containing protein n=1 Tax=Ekhidna sp. TaxID=2608089 RepID=UPI0032EEFAEC
MKYNYLCYSLFLIFLALSFLHFYWAFFGNWGFEQALPKNVDGSLVLAPTSIDSVIVGTALLFFALFYLFLASQVIRIPKWINRTFGWLIPIIFLIRAIGDFRYVGFLKTVDSTSFAQTDYLFYSPLCLLISILGFMVLKKRGA